MKIFVLALAAFFFLSCNNGSGDSSNNSDSLMSDTGYVPTTDTVSANSSNTDLDTMAYGMADSARL